MTDYQTMYLMQQEELRDLLHTENQLGDRILKYEGQIDDIRKKITKLIDQGLRYYGTVSVADLKDLLEEIENYGK